VFARKISERVVNKLKTSFFTIFIYMKEEQQIRKFIREALASEKSLLRESFYDDSVESLEDKMLKPWLIYYKHFAKDGYDALGEIHRATFNTRLTAQEKVQLINDIFVQYLQSIHRLPSPNLNQ